MGKYGIMSAPDGARVVEPHDIDMVIVPLVAFDENRNRIGYGGGYYDTYLKSCKKAFKCGAAYEIQKHKKIVPEEHDLLLDLIVTEYKTY
jgi:5-formyltetrahydrofolate cyclo-ligase